MSNSKKHIIQKQLIDITLPHATAALEWESTKRRDFTALINKQLERCFDDYDKNGDHLVMEKLDVDLGVFTMNNLQEEVSERLYSKLYQRLQEHSKTTTYAGSETAERTYADSSTDRFYTGQEGRLEALFYFLSNGRLPWWGAELADWDETWLTSLTENEVSRFKNFITRSDGEPIRRLTIRFNDGFIEQLLQRFGITDEAATAWQWLEMLLKNLQEDVARPASYADNSFQSYRRLLLPAVARTEYWVAWILYAVGKREIPPLHKLFNDRPEALEIIYSAIKSKYNNPKLSVKIPPLWEKEIDAIIKQKEDYKRISATDNKEIQNIQQADKAVFAEGIQPAGKNNEALLQIPADDAIIGKPDTLSKLADKKNKTENEEAIFVANAGLIILHPFLPELFRHCGWLEKNKFINEYTQTMAVYALHYLATGETDVPEYQLMFPKFLAGMEWEALLEPVEPLNDEEQAACNELLAEVLKHWKPLRNTSPQGLQEAYLQRNGKLEHIYSGWHLSIEQKTLDILLSRLPWGISMIKLPWMTQPLTVAWQ
ncbi:MAG TPA: contractile injection system tape measure protein [Parafilimonas sp.]|nr:contractile injection system tape measure protein [Parafilimonas sp.]